VIISIARGAIVRVEALPFRRRDARDCYGRMRIGVDACRFDIRTGPVFGMAGGTLPPPNLAKMFKHSISVTAFWLLTLTQQPARFKVIVQELMDFVDQQEIRPVIGKVYPLKDAAEALKALESRQTYGKLVLKP